MKSIKKPLLSLLVLLFAFSLIPNSADAAVSARWAVRPTTSGEYDGCIIDNHQGGNITVRIWQQGIHAGEEAYIRWTLRNMDTGAWMGSFYLHDFDSTITFTNIPKGDYSLTWESLTNNDTEGWYYVVSNGGSIWR